MFLFTGHLWASQVGLAINLVAMMTWMFDVIALAWVSHAANGGLARAGEADGLDHRLIRIAILLVVRGDVTIKALRLKNSRVHLWMVEFAWSGVRMFAGIFGLLLVQSVISWL